MSAQRSTTELAAPVALGPKERRITRAAGVALAVLGAVLVWVVVDPLLGVDLSVTKSGTTTVVGPGLIIGMTIGASLLGWALLAVLERATSNARRIWSITAVVVLLLSFAMPFNSGEADASAQWSLVLLHVVVGAAVIPLFARSARR